MARYHYIQDRKHPLASYKGGVAYHRAILYAKIGDGPHPCHWCGKTLYWMNAGRNSEHTLCVDHLDNDGQNNIPSNLVPSCHRCNCTRKRTNLVRDNEVFVYMKGNRGRHRAEIRICQTCGREFPFILADKRPNRGRYCSPKCMYNRNKSKVRESDCDILYLDYQPHYHREP